VDGVVHLFVDPHQLLAARGDARLGRRGRAAATTMCSSISRLCASSPRSESPRWSSPITATSRHSAPIAHDVRSDIGGAAQRVASRLHRHDRYRSLGRDAFGLARQIDVEHRVA